MLLILVLPRLKHAARGRDHACSMFGPRMLAWSKCHACSEAQTVAEAAVSVAVEPKNMDGSH